MAAILPSVETIAYALGTLDVQRMLRMGQVVTLSIYKPDVTQPGGMRLIRTYTKGFSRMTANERQLAEGKTIIYEIADLSVNGEYPVGQLPDDFRGDNSMLVIDADGVTSTYQIDSVTAPDAEKAQIYVITCEARRLVNSFTRP